MSRRLASASFVPEGLGRSQAKTSPIGPAGVLLVLTLVAAAAAGIYWRMRRSTSQEGEQPVDADIESDVSPASGFQPNSAPSEATSPQIEEMLPQVEDEPPGDRRQD